MNESAKNQARRKSLHLMSATRLNSWRRVLRRYGRNMSSSGKRRAAWVTLLSTLGCPARFWESLRYAKQVRHQNLEPPIFILGHWRSGTTNCHNLMLQDPQLGAVSMLHSLLSPSFLTLGKPLRRLLKRQLPNKRAMDQVPLGVDSPMSEDSAMACLTEWSHYHRYFFPSFDQEIIGRSVLFEGVDDNDIQRWFHEYDRLLRKVTVANGGKRLVLKNPPNIGRVRHLLRFYPDASFIHVYRNPYEVIASTQKMMMKFLEQFSFEDFQVDEVLSNVLQTYSRSMGRFFKDENLLPQSNFVSVAHEDLVRDGVGTVDQIYRKLNLSGFAEMQPRLESYVRSTCNYRNNAYEYNTGFVEQVQKHCGFAIDRWNYEVPRDISR